MGCRYCLESGGSFHVFESQQVDAWIRNPSTFDGSCSNEDNFSSSLLCYPAECNFSGRCFPLDWCTSLSRDRVRVRCEHEENVCSLAHSEQHSKWFTLIDAAKFVQTHPLNLDETHPDFVALSFYKMFGYPTGLGALLVRNGIKSYVVFHLFCFSYKGHGFDD